MVAVEILVLTVYRPATLQVTEEFLHRAAGEAVQQAVRLRQQVVQLCQDLVDFPEVREEHLPGPPAQALMLLLE